MMILAKENFLVYERHYLKIFEKMFKTNVTHEKSNFNDVIPKIFEEN